MIAANFTQLMPTWDERHAWWGAPTACLLTFAVAGRWAKGKGFTGNVLVLPLVAATVMSIFAASFYLKVERVEIEGGTIADGMLVSQVANDEFLEDPRFLNSVLPPKSHPFYLVRRGDVSVLSGLYLSSDRVDSSKMPA